MTLIPKVKAAFRAALKKSASKTSNHVCEKQLSLPSTDTSAIANHADGPKFGVLRETQLSLSTPNASIITYRADGQYLRRATQLSFQPKAR